MPPRIDPERFMNEMVELNQVDINSSLSSYFNVVTRSGIWHQLNFECAETRIITSCNNSPADRTHIREVLEREFPHITIADNDVVFLAITLNNSDEETTYTLYKDILRFFDDRERFNYEVEWPYKPPSLGLVVSRSIDLIDSVKLCRKSSNRELLDKFLRRPADFIGISESARNSTDEDTLQNEHIVPINSIINKCLVIWDEDRGTEDEKREHIIEIVV